MSQQKSVPDIIAELRELSRAAGPELILMRKRPFLLNENMQRIDQNRIEILEDAANALEMLTSRTNP